MADHYPIIELAEDESVEATVVDGYVWCEQRGMIHDTLLSHVTTARHGGVVFYDIYDDCELCADQDHKPVYTTGEID